MDEIVDEWEAHENCNLDYLKQIEVMQLSNI
jgi:hypothetical protein